MNELMNEWIHAAVAQSIKSIWRRDFDVYFERNTVFLNLSDKSKLYTIYLGYEIKIIRTWVKKITKNKLDEFLSRCDTTGFLIKSVKCGVNVSSGVEQYFHLLQKGITSWML